MNIEIERKFLVRSDSYKQQAEKRTLYRQGYLKSKGKSLVRVRIAGKKAYITIKGESKSISRIEFEYEIPLIDANFMLQSLCEGYIIEKYRYIIPASNALFWEVDEFIGNNEGLVIAEIELKTDNDIFDKPDWLGKEVSVDSRYYNSYLSEKPYNEWEKII